jgi:hypothetical protein
MSLANKEPEKDNPIIYSQNIIHIKITREEKEEKNTSHFSTN